MCDQLGVSPKISVCIAVKRHHTRVFPLSYPGDKLGNVLPGTIFEASATPKDVFLVSHSALQGTVRPCHYTVVHDENLLSQDDFQRIGKDSLSYVAGSAGLTLSIVYGLCFAYGRSSRSVGLFPAIYYAVK